MKELRRGRRRRRGRGEREREGTTLRKGGMEEREKERNTMLTKDAWRRREGSKKKTNTDGQMDRRQSQTN